MNSFEKLIRTALSRQDASSAQVRTQVYATARSALDRTMRDRSDLSAQAVAEGRRNLEAVIRQVEGEYAARSAPQQPDTQTQPNPQVAPPVNSPIASPNSSPGVAKGSEQSRPTITPQPSAPRPAPPAAPAGPLSGLRASRNTPTAAGTTSNATSLAPGPKAPVRSVFGDAPAPSAPSAPRTASPARAAAPTSERREPGFSGATRGTDGAVSQPSPQVNAAPAPQPAMAPAAPTPTPRASTAGSVPQAAKTRRQRVRELRGPTRIYSYILSAALLIAFVVIAVWWVQENDLLSPVANRDGATANPPGTTASGAASTERVDERDWINVLEAVQPDRVIVNGANAARLVDIGGEPIIEMTFAAERVVGGDFLIEVDEAVLSQFAGSTVLFDLAMQGVSRTGTEDVSLSVECDFAAMGDCGRKRYTVPLQPASMVFSVDLPNVQPGGAGVLRISGVGESAQGGVIGLSNIRITGDGF